MSWLDRARRRAPVRAGVTDPTAEQTGPVERRSPGLAALFEALHDDGRHTLLDLGPAGAIHLRLFTPFAQRIRFAALAPRPPRAERFTHALQSLKSSRDPLFDVVLTWDLLERVAPTERDRLIQRLADVTARGARLYAVLDASGANTRVPTRSTLVALDRVASEAVGPSEPAPDPLLPAQVERLLAPFKVAHAFTLRTGLREYVAVKP